MAQTALPRRRPELQKRRHGTETLLVDGTGNRMCVLNATALALWELCDGATSPEEMADAVAQLCGISRARAIEDVRSALQALGGIGALDWSEGPAPSEPVRD